MNNETEKKNSRLSQGDMPRSTLKEVIVLAESLRDDFAGKNATPIDLAKSIDRSPTSSAWRSLTGAAVAYGITDGGYGAALISLTSLGRQIVSPTEEGAEKTALLSALLRPAILKNFYEKYDKSKLPKDEIGKNVLHQLGVPQDRTEEALKIVKENADYVGILTEASGNQYIQLEILNSANENKTTHHNSFIDTEKREVINSTVQNSNPEIFHFMENEIGVILTKEINQKSWLNEELLKKVQNLMHAAQALSEEWKKQKQSDQN